MNFNLFTYSNYIETTHFLGDCDIVLTNRTGQITSPNYPNHYSPNALCNYYINPKSNDKIFIDIKEINTEEGCDFLTIYDGNSSSYEQVARLSGTKGGSFTVGKNVLVQFKSDGSNNYKGFRLVYKSVWQGILILILS